MSTKISAITLRSLLLLALLCPIQSSFAQEEFEDDVNDEAPQMFIDGFVGIGLIAGAAFGYAKLRNREQ